MFATIIFWNILVKCSFFLQTLPQINKCWLTSCHRQNQKSSIVELYLKCIWNMTYWKLLIKMVNDLLRWTIYFCQKIFLLNIWESWAKLVLDFTSSKTYSNKEIKCNLLHVFLYCLCCTSITKLRFNGGIHCQLNYKPHVFMVKVSNRVKFCRSKDNKIVEQIIRYLIAQLSNKCGHWKFSVLAYENAAVWNPLYS